MVKELEKANIKREADFQRMKINNLRDATQKGKDTGRKVKHDNLDIYMCDCDQWGGDPAPCDDCR